VSKYHQNCQNVSKSLAVEDESRLALHKHSGALVHYLLYGF